MGQYIAASIMFLVTIGFAALFWLPAVRFQHKNELVKFYWVGFWAFLGGITSLSGAQAVLTIMQYDVTRISQALLFGMTVAFVLFVMFAWGRLSLHGLTHLVVKNRSA